MLRFIQTFNFLFLSAWNRSWREHARQMEWRRWIFIWSSTSLQFINKNINKLLSLQKETKSTPEGAVNNEKEDESSNGKNVWRNQRPTGTSFRLRFIFFPQYSTHFRGKILMSCSGYFTKTNICVQPCRGCTIHKPINTMNAFIPLCLKQPCVTVLSGRMTLFHWPQIENASWEL